MISDDVPPPSSLLPPSLQSTSRFAIAASIVARLNPDSPLSAIQVGQCGNQLGTAFWEHLLIEHGLDKS